MAKAQPTWRPLHQGPARRFTGEDEGDHVERKMCGLPGSRLQSAKRWGKQIKESPMSKNWNDKNTKWNVMMRDNEGQAELRKTCQEIDMALFDDVFNFRHVQFLPSTHSEGLFSATGVGKCHIKGGEAHSFHGHQESLQHQFAGARSPYPSHAFSK